LSARDINPLVAELARAKRRMDRIGGMLVAAEARHRAAADALDRAIQDACRPLRAPPAVPPLRFGRAPEVPETRPNVLAVVQQLRNSAPGQQSAAIVNGYRVMRCGRCGNLGHTRVKCKVTP
jgi:hypothetical protein